MLLLLGSKSEQAKHDPISAGAILTRRIDSVTGTICAAFAEWGWRAAALFSIDFLEAAGAWAISGYGVFVKKSAFKHIFLLCLAGSILAPAKAESPQKEQIEAPRSRADIAGQANGVISEIAPATIRQPTVPVTVVAEKSAKFEVLSSDKTLSYALRRWAVAHGYQLVWDVQKDFPARHTKYEGKDFEEALEEVMRDLALTVYPLHACVYRNNVVRVLHVSNSCER